MNLFEIAFLLLLFSAIAAAFVPRLRLPQEVVLLVGSLFLGFLPGVPRLTLDPSIVFFLFLPPILFAAAYFTSWRDFKMNLRPISLLAIGLVVFTTAAVAWAMRSLIPGMTWPVAIALGAMVSPPDASAATSITRKLGIPRRLVTIIEGESLVNDATALVLYRFALAAVATGAFSIQLGLAKFLWMGGGGILVGLIIGRAGMWFYRRMPETRAQILMSFLTAFASYSVGEHLGVSGVISTVTAGLHFGHWLPVKATAEIRIEAKATWDFVLFVINGFVFALMGLQLPSVLQNLSGYSAGQLAVYAITLSIIVVVVRFLWVFPATYVPRWVSAALSKRDPAPPWQAVVALSYTGMRGIVSLAAALALPVGNEFPMRDLVIFLTYATILTTLLIPSLTLPSLLRYLGLKAGDENFREEMNARLITTRAVAEAFSDLEKKHVRASISLEQMRRRYERRIRTFESNLKAEPYSELFEDDREARLLLRDMIELERGALIKLRNDGAIHDEVFHTIARELDLEDLRLGTQRL